MTKTPLYRSRKFWLMVADVAISTAVYFVTNFMSPEIGKTVLWLIGSWQPVIVAVIYGLVQEDGAISDAKLYNIPISK
jgi:hypothetical protein